MTTKQWGYGILVGGIFGWGGGHFALATALPKLLWKVQIGYADKPNAGDVNGDGRLDVVVGAGKRTVALSGETGELLWAFEAEGDVLTCPAIADLDGDGELEVVFGSSDRSFYCVHGTDGKLKWKIRTKKYLRSSPTIADMDGDTSLEVIFSGFDRHLYVVHGADGSLVWKALLDKPSGCPPAVVELNGDSTLDVVVGCDGGLVYAFSGADGSLLWKTPLGGTIGSGPLVVEVDRQKYIIVNSVVVACLDGRTGQPIWRFVPPSGRGFLATPSVGDVNGDGKLEVLAHCYDTYLYALSLDQGQVLWKSQVSSQFGGGSSPAIADFDGSGTMQVLVCATDHKFVALSGKTGKVLWQYPMDWHSHSCPLVADINGDGKLEVVYGSADGCLYALTNGAAGKVVWAKYHGDVRSTGTYAAGVKDGALLAVGKPTEAGRPRPFPALPTASSEVVLEEGSTVTPDSVSQEASLPLDSEAGT